MPFDSQNCKRNLVASAKNFFVIPNVLSMSTAQKTKHSSDEMLSQNIGKNKIDNLHSAEILSEMNYQTRATSYCWLWKLRDESLSNTPQ